MIIEFTGITGAGKTSLAKKMAEYYTTSEAEDALYSLEKLKKIGLRLYNTKYKHVLAYFNLLFCKPNYLYIIPHIVFRKCELKEKKIIFIWFFDMLIYYELIKTILERNPTAVFILDEGYIHRLHLLYTTCDKICTEKEVVKYLQMNPLESFLVFVNCDIDTAFERLNNRGWSPRFNKCTISQKKSLMENFKKVDELIKKHNKAKSIQINNNIIKKDNSEQFKQIFKSVF